MLAYFAWGGLVAILVLASLAFDIGMTGALSHAQEAPHEYSGLEFPNAVEQQDDAQLHDGRMNRVCGPSCATWRRAPRSPPPAIRIGGRGCCTGDGLMRVRVAEK